MTMKRRLTAYALITLAALALAQSAAPIYSDNELDAALRAAFASLIAIAVYVLSVLQHPRSQRPAWDVAIARALLTGLFALVAVLLIRMLHPSLAAEWLTAAVVGGEGPRALDWLRERFKLLTGGKNG